MLPTLLGSNGWICEEERGEEKEEEGLQRLQARNPADWASVAESKKTMLARRARREGHAGRQNMRVVVTAYTNAEAASGSRACKARHRDSGVLNILYWGRPGDTVVGLSVGVSIS